MATRIRRVDYFYANVQDRPGEAYKLLSVLGDLGINLLAFTAVPTGPAQTQMSIFPEDSDLLVREAKRTGIELDGPHPALLAQGDDEIGALAAVHEKLYQAGVNVYAATGVTDGKGDFGYLIYIRPEEFAKAEAALEL